MGRLSGGWSPLKSRIHSAPSGLCLETPWHLRGWARVFPVSPLARNWAPSSLQPHPAPTSQHLPADEPPEDGQQVLALPPTTQPLWGPQEQVMSSFSVFKSISPSSVSMGQWGHRDNQETSRRERATPSLQSSQAQAILLPQLPSSWDHRHPPLPPDKDASKRTLPTSLLTGGLCDCGRTGPGGTHHLPPEAPPPRRHPRKIHRLAQTRRFLSSSCVFTPLDWFVNPFSYPCFLWMLNATFFVAER
ncbi:uncharacterized protein LOC116813649 [Hylobates moloch]|uniref:uncharacterized protein LOC116813649 n=1 Tax=Hylobates moloch TaxID=81572 RepID=UPI0026765A5E|nr:uncharacterized protein LOC116813649 [Hylobates moloch]